MRPGTRSTRDVVHHQKCRNLISPWPAPTDGHLHRPEQVDTHLPGSPDHAGSGSVFCDQVLVMFLPFLGQPLQERPRKVTLVMQGDHCLWWYIRVDFVAKGQGVSNANYTIYRKACVHLTSIEYKSELPNDASSQSTQ